MKKWLAILGTILLAGALLPAPAGAVSPAPPLAVVLRTGDPAPDGVGMVATLTPPTVNSRGVVAFGAQLSGPGVTIYNDYALYAGSPGALVALAREGDRAPGGAGVYQSPPADAAGAFRGLPRLAEDGGTAFLAAVDPTGRARSADQAGLFTPTQPIARHGDPVAGTAQRRLYMDTDTANPPALADGGFVAFGAAAYGAGYDLIGGPDHDSLLFAGTPGRLQTVARRGAVTPDGGRFETLNPAEDRLGFGPPAVNRTGQVAFTARVLGRVTGAYQNGQYDALYLWQDGRLQKLVAQGDGVGAATVGALYTVKYAPALNVAGTVAIQASLDGGEGILLAGGGEVKLVAASGDPAPGGGVYRHLSWQPALNDAGQVAFGAVLGSCATCLDRVQALFTGQPDALVAVARSGQPAPEGNGVFLNLVRSDYRSFTAHGLNLNARGQLAFLAEVGDPLAAGRPDVGLYLWEGGTLQKVVRTGDLLDGKQVAEVFLAAPTSPGIRGLAGDGGLAFLVTFADQTAAVVMTGAAPAPQPAPPPAPVPGPVPPPAPAPGTGDCPPPPPGPGGPAFGPARTGFLGTVGGEVTSGFRFSTGAQLAYGRGDITLSDTAPWQLLADQIQDLGPGGFQTTLTYTDTNWQTQVPLQEGHVYLMRTADGLLVQVVPGPLETSTYGGKGVRFQWAAASSGAADGGKAAAGDAGTGTGTPCPPPGTKPSPAPTPAPVPQPQPVPEPQPMPPAGSDAPRNLTATPGAEGVVLSWQPPAAFQGRPVGYAVYQGPAPGQEGTTPLGDFPADGTTYTDPTALAGETYYYVVKVVYADGRTGAPSNEAAIGPRRGTGVTVWLQVGNRTARVNGEPVILDVAPRVADGRTLVPLRFLGNALGAEMSFDPADRHIRFALGGRQIDLWLDRAEALVNGRPVTLDTAPTVVNGRTLVPLRFLSERLGADVTYNPGDQSITVTYPGQGQSAAPPAGPVAPPAGPAAGSWVAQASGTDADLRGVYFVSSSTGWAVGARGTILFTTDGGQTWQARDSGTYQALNDVYFQDARRGWVVGRAATILTTTDGGRTWQRVERPREMGGAVELKRIWFTDDQHGFLAGHYTPIDVRQNDTRAALWSTADGGATWQQVWLADTIDVLADVSIRGNQGWMILHYPAKGAKLETEIRASNDGGRTWTIYSTKNVLPLLTALIQGPSGQALLVGKAGQIYLLEDPQAGLAVVDGDYRKDRDYHAVALSPDGELWVGGSAGTIAHWSAATGTWREEATGTGATVLRLAALDARHAWAVGTGGTILRYEPGR